MADKTFRASYKGIGQMLNMPEMVEEMGRRGQRVKDRAMETAPVGKPPDDSHPGRYKAALREKHGAKGGEKNDRAYSEVSNDSPEAAAVEFGYNETPKYATLRKALPYAAGD
jgi:hypothetical protein